MSFSYFRIIDDLGRNDSHGFGRVPDPPEPPSDKWFEKHCPRCKHNHEYEENGEWFAECDEGCYCEFEEREDEE